ncbi:GntR family transcriptional regulator [Streptomyces fumigatiscleroticus]|nr:GntR family transcriptional regulator [Streptomyces fumigatiscleroticus]
MATMPQEPAAGQAARPPRKTPGTRLPGLGAPPARTRAEQLAAALGERIHSLGLRAGDPVGTLESLREETGYAYSTVSEAVRVLRDRGILEIRPGRGGGLFVAERGPVVRLRHTLLDVRDEPTTVADAIELRDHLEVLVDLGAARCRTDEDVAELRAQVERLRAAPDWDAFMRANWALHERIARICPNRMAAAVYTGTLGHLSSASSRSADDPAAAERYRAERCQVHADLVEAIAAGDEAAVRAAVARHNTPA